MKNDSSSARLLQLLRALIAASQAGVRLPSVRELQRKHRISPITVRHAMATLIGEGVVETRPGHGTFVRALSKIAPSDVDLSWQSATLGPARPGAQALGALVTPTPAGALALSTGYLPADLQPIEALRRAMANAARRPSIWDRTPPEGLESLRAWFARELHHGVNPHDVLICPGSQAAITATLRALTEPGAALLVESPTYIGVLAAAEAAGLKVIPVPTDAAGVRPDLLAEAFRSSGARVFYCQPTYANPTGTILPPARRRLVHELVAASGAFLIEDDWARDLRFAGSVTTPLAAEYRDGHVVYIRSLTKPAAPSLRIAAVISQGAARARIRATRIIEDFFVAGPLQEAALQLVTTGAWHRHLRSMRMTLLERRDAMVQAVHSVFGSDAIAHIPGGGFHLWVRLPAGVDDMQLARMAAQRQVIVSPGSQWFPAEAPWPHVRLTFAAAGTADLQRGVRLLASIVQQIAT